MAVTIATTQLYAPPSTTAAQTKLTITAAGNIVRLYVTSAPEGSSMRTSLDANDGREVEVTTRDIPGGPRGGWDPADSTVTTLPFEVGGKYTFRALDLQRGQASGFRGGYAGDPLGNTDDTVLAETFVEVNIGQRLTTPVGAQPYGAGELVIWVWDGFVRRTRLFEQHPEDSPAIINVTGQRMLAASESAGTVAALAAMVDVSTSALVGDITALYQDLRAQIPLHMTNNGGGFHGLPDTFNNTGVANLPRDPGSPEGFGVALREMSQLVRQHQRNSSLGFAFGTQRFHEVGGDARPDTEHVLLALGAGGATPAVNIQSIAALRAQWIAHIASAEHHALADGTNLITASTSPLLDLHSAIFAQLLLTSPTERAVDNAGVARLRHEGGFLTG